MDLHNTEVATELYVCNVMTIWMQRTRSQL